MLLLMGDAFQENFTRITFTKVVFFFFFFFEWILSPGCAPVSLLSFYSHHFLNYWDEHIDSNCEKKSYNEES